jgi:hypothetical protein
MPNPVTAVGGGLGLIGASKQADAAKSAARTSAAASDYAADLQKQMYDQTRADQTPWRETGEDSLNMLANYMGFPGSGPKTSQSGSLMRNFSMKDYQADPGYAFRLSEGMKALDRSAASRGGLLSGATLKGAQQYGQDMASQEYQNAYNRYQSNQTNQFNRLGQIAGVGQTANNALQQAGGDYANNVGNLSMKNAANQGNAALAAGQARASAYGGLGTTLGNALNNTNIGGYLGQAASNTFGTTPAVGYGYGEPADWGWGG